MNELFTLCAKRLKVKEKGADRRFLKGWLGTAVYSPGPSPADREKSAGT